MKIKAASGIMLTLLLIGMLTLAFDIQPVRASGTIVIWIDGTVNPPTVPIQREGDVYTFTDNIYDSIVVCRDNIMVDGAGYPLQGTGGGTGIDLFDRSNVTIKNMEIKAFYYGIYLSWSSDNNISGNNITNNGCGIRFSASSNNIVYNNNFIDNTQQVYIVTSGYTNFWDDGYPSGGNYWSDHVTVDDCCGINQDEPGSDGIVDEPYIIVYYIRDNYPLMNPWTPAPPTVVATADVAPNTLNLKSKGEWITCYVELPEGYNVSDIDIYSIRLNDTFPISLIVIPPVPVPTEIGDYDEDGIPDLMVKFNMTELTSYICLQGIKYGNVTLTITGMVDETPFEGEDTVKVLIPGDLDHDDDVDDDDFVLFGGNYGKKL